MAKTPVNFHFFLARADSTFAGIRASEVADPYQKRHGLVPSLVVGPQLKRKDDRPVKWATIIPPGMEDLPQFSSRGKSDDKIVGGSIIKVIESGEEKHFLVSHRDEQAYYVLVRTGLMAVNGSSVEDRLNIKKDRELVSHGSYSFDQGSIRIATAEDFAKVTADPSVAIASVAAERMGVKIMGKFIQLADGKKIPETSYVLWKMPFGAVLLVRDVNGKLTRLVSQKDQLRRVDASGYANFFTMLEEAHERERAKAKEQRQLAKIAAAAVQTPSST